MTDRPEGMPPWRHIDNAEVLLTRVENGTLTTTDVLLASIAHALIALVKITQKGPRGDRH